MNKRFTAFATVLAAALLLTGCNDNDEEPAPPMRNEVPASATASPQAWTRYAASLQNTETGEPATMEQVGTPPTTETEEPAAL